MYHYSFHCQSSTALYASCGLFIHDVDCLWSGLCLHPRKLPPVTIQALRCPLIRMLPVQSLHLPRLKPHSPYGWHSGFPTMLWHLIPLLCIDACLYFTEHLYLGLARRWHTEFYIPKGFTVLAFAEFEKIHILPYGSSGLNTSTSIEQDTPNSNQC